MVSVIMMYSCYKPSVKFYASINFEGGIFGLAKNSGVFLWWVFRISNKKNFFSIFYYWFTAIESILYSTRITGKSYSS